MKLPKGVIGVANMKIVQLLKVYAPIWIYAIVFLYVIIRNMACDCVTATMGEGLLVMVVTLVIFMYTRWMYRIEERKNFIHKDPKDIVK